MSLKRAREILFAYGDKNDYTAHPWWGIVKRAGLGRYELLAGPFFSRESAESKRRRRIYHYGERSFVYCFSGHDSEDYVQLREEVGRP